MKTLLSYAVCMLLAIPALHAYSEPGMKTYIKSCKKCHGGPYKGAFMKESDEWKELFKDGDEKMLAIHKDNDAALKKLSKSYYKNRRHHLVDFLINNARDTGTVPGCDTNNCGK